MKVLKGLFVMGLIAVGLVLGQAVMAQSEGPLIEFQYFEEYILKSGDTVCAISDLSSPALTSTGGACVPGGNTAM